MLADHGRRGVIAIPTYRLEILEPTIAEGVWFRRSFEAATDEEAKASAMELFDEYALDAGYGYVLYEDERVIHKHVVSRRRFS